MFPIATRRTVAQAAIATLSLLAVPAFAAFDANIEFDNTWLSSQKDSKGADVAGRGLQQGGRVEFNALAKAGTNGFIAGKASYLATRSGSASVDDMWVQVGTSAADIKLGRFEAADLFPLPRDVIVSSVGSVYRTNTLRGRFGNSNDGVGIFHAAGTLNLGSGLSFELGVVETDDKTTTKGVRPVLTYAAGPLTAKLGVEAIKYAGATTTSEQKSQTGMGVSLAYKAGDFTFIGNAASAKTAADAKQSTVGLVASADSGLTVGVISGKTGSIKTNIGYLAYSMPLFDIKGASWTPAVSVAKTDGSDDDTGVKVRFNYAF
jgi:hypothetical protein